MPKYPGRETCRGSEAGFATPRRTTYHTRVIKGSISHSFLLWKAATVNVIAGTCCIRKQGKVSQTRRTTSTRIYRLLSARASRVNMRPFFSEQRTVKDRETSDRTAVQSEASLSGIAVGVGHGLGNSIRQGSTRKDWRAGSQQNITYQN